MAWRRRLATSALASSSCSAENSPPMSDLRMVSFWMRIFSVLVTTTLKEEPRITGTSFSPSRVNVSFTDAAKGLCRRGGRMRSYETSASSRSDSMMVLPGANTRALCTNSPSGYSSASANSVAMMAPMSMVFPAPMARARM